MADGRLMFKFYRQPGRWQQWILCSSRVYQYECREPIIVIIAEPNKEFKIYKTLNNLKVGTRRDVAPSWISRLTKWQSFPVRTEENTYLSCHYSPNLSLPPFEEIDNFQATQDFPAFGRFFSDRPFTPTFWWRPIYPVLNFFEYIWSIHPPIWTEVSRIAEKNYWSIQTNVKLVYILLFRSGMYL
jgi:hypothetical protein